MSVPNQVENSEVVYGAGFVSVDPIVAGAYTGERYLGETPGCTLAIQTEEAQTYSSDGHVPRLLEDTVRQVTRSITLTVQNVVAANYALFILGDEPSKYGASNVAVVDEDYVARKGRWLQLGRTAQMPLGHAAISASNVTVEPDGGGTAFEAGSVEGDDDVDYIVDAPRGRIYVTEAGAIADKAAIQISYTPDNPAGGYLATKTGAAKRVEAALDYHEDAGAGKGVHLYARLCSIVGSGSAEMKGRDTPQQIRLACAIKTPAAPWPDLIIGEAA